MVALERRSKNPTYNPTLCIDAQIHNPTLVCVCVVTRVETYLYIFGLRAPEGPSLNLRAQR